MISVDLDVTGSIEKLLEYLKKAPLDEWTVNTTAGAVDLKAAGDQCTTDYSFLGDGPRYMGWVRLDTNDEWLTHDIYVKQTEAEYLENNRFFWRLVQDHPNLKCISGDKRYESWAEFRQVLAREL